MEARPGPERDDDPDAAVGLPPTGPATALGALRKAKPAGRTKPSAGPPPEPHPSPNRSQSQGRELPDRRRSPSPGRSQSQGRELPDHRPSPSHNPSRNRNRGRATQRRKQP